MHDAEESFQNRLSEMSAFFHPVLHFDAGSEKIISLDFSHKNKELEQVDFEDTPALTRYVSRILAEKGAQYGTGGYGELRTVYSRSKLFNKDLGKDFREDEPRRLHLGMDVWGPVGTPVYAPADGSIHSFAFNDRFGDYGATLILRHEINDLVLHTLYGHISLTDIEPLQRDMKVKKGDLIAHFGNEKENGFWRPHLHFQLIRDMHGFEGDYPGVCKLSERRIYLQNCPDPDVVLNLKKYL